MNVEKLLQTMTLKEKVGQLNQRLYGWEVYEKKDGKIELTDMFKQEVDRWGSVGFIYGVFRSDPWSGKNRETGILAHEAREVSQLIQTYIKENTRLGIPTFLSEECPHGHQGLDSLTTPANISAGMSWNPTLYQEVQEIVAREIRVKGAHIGLVSTLDVARDPRWGRTEECFSEDPFLTSEFTIGALKGLQGHNKDNVDSEHVIATLKHFAGQGSAMGGHNSGPVNIGERELREIHLPPMKAAISHGAQMTMAAYNDVDGIPCHGNKQLLNDILRDELNFEGAVMADGCALDRLVEVTGDPLDAAVWAITSGVDISLWDEVYPYLEEAVETKRLPEDILDQAVLRVLKLKQSMGLFEDSTPEVEDFSAEEKHEKAVKLAKESLVLLKNDAHCLPLVGEELTKIAVIGPNANYLYNQLGDYTPFKDEEICTTVLQGIQSEADRRGIEVVYHQGTGITTSITNGIEEAKLVSEQADKIIVVLGGSSARDFTTTFDTNGAAISGSNEMTSGENIDLSDLDIPKIQYELLVALRKLGKPIIGVVIQGRPHVLTEVEPLLDAVLIAGYPGENGGEAIASILFGESPSGKLAMSIPRSTGQLPVYYNYRDIAFKKDYVEMSGEPQFSFGTGLSYTTFEIKNVSIDSAKIVLDDKESVVTVSGEITNTGAVSGAEVVQIYVKSHQKRVITRIKELKGFEKIWLDPNETRTFSIDLHLSELDDSLIEKPMTEITVIVEATNFSESKKIEIF